MNSFYSEDELKYLGLKKYGVKVLISRFSRIYGAEQIEIGNNVRIDDFCILSGRITIGNYIHISAATLLFAGSSGIILEDYTSISSRSAVYAESDDYSGNGMANPMIPDKFRNVQCGAVILKKHALVGSGSTILPGVIIGEGASVGSMSLVSKSLEPWSMNVGIPSRKIKERSHKILVLEKQFLEEKDEY